MVESNAASSDNHDEDDEDDHEEAGGGSRLLGFMFGNVDDSGDLDVDYLDEEAKEHIAALADKLGSSLKDIDLSVKSSTPTDASEQDYDEKALDAVDYEDIEEQYEGPEIEVATEEDHLLPKKDYFSSEMSLASLDQKASIYDEENYDEDEDLPKEPEAANIFENKADNVLTGSFVDASTEKDRSIDDDLLSLGSVGEDLVVNYGDILEEPVSLQDAPDDKKENTLPVLCVEDGMVILRFSEIFGVHEPPKKGYKRDHHRFSFLKEHLKSLDLVNGVEEDEEVFMKSCQGHSIPKSSILTEEGDSPIRDSDLDSRGFGISSSYVEKHEKNSCLPAQPMKESSVIDTVVAWQSASCPECYPLDQEDWEQAIVWADSSPESHVTSLNYFGQDSIESEPHASSQVEAGSVNQHMDSKYHDDADNENNSASLSHCFSLELFGSREFSESVERNYHPQLLRLEAHSELERSGSDFSKSKKVNGTEECIGGEIIKRLSKLSLRNKDLLDGSWLDNIVWDSAETVPKPKLILDLQDERMLFEIFDSNKDGRHLRSHAGAMIITRSSKSGSADSFDVPAQGGPPSGRFNISNDKYYSNRKTSQLSKSHSKKRAVHGVKILHSVPALKLQTMKPKLSNKDIANFHRPKAIWYPHDNEVAAKEQGKLSTQGPMKIILKSMGGKGSKFHVAAEETLVSVKGKASKKLDFKLTEKVKVFYRGKELEDDKMLAMQNVRPNSVLHLVRSRIYLWPRAQKLPGENRPLRPPGAFKKKSELSVKVGHVFLMEYCEERPLLMGNVGMGARLCTYYQKSGPTDQTASLLKSENNCVGNVIALDPADKSPFLGDVRPGCSQSSLETNMFRAPIFPQKPSSTDYLLVRSSKGKLSLRRIDKLYTVGQQEPHVEVMSPGSKSFQTYIGNRLLVYVYREFRANEKPGSLPFVRADELSAQFPNISEAFLRKRLKHCADLQKGINGQLFWVMRRNFRIPSEEELRRLVTPENVCTYESMQAGLCRLKRLGITRLTHPAGLSFAMNQLPDEAIALAAAAHIERELQITSWNLTSNFVACTNQDRENIERLEITGVGDPSGRGLGFSYVRVAPKAPIATPMMKKKTAAARANSTVTGTDADLRRLSMDAAREVLIKFGVPEEQIEKMTRWHRIAMVRKLSSEQAASGVKVDATTLSKYARGQRMSFLQLQQQAREKCQEIWDRQVQSLSAVEGDENDSDSEANSDLDSFAGDLENLLDAEECEEGDEGNFESKGGKIDGVRGLKMRRAPWQCQTEEEIEDEAAEAAELCRMLLDDDEMDRKKKKKAKPFEDNQALGSHLGFVSEKIGPATNTMIKKGEGSFPTRNSVGVTKSKKVKHDFQLGLLTKKNKANGDGLKVKEKKNPDKPVRENFVCGACGQQGHMRTNKNCPKYGEDLEVHVKSMEPETPKLPPKPLTEVPVPQLSEPPPIKRLIPKAMTRTTSVETLESSEQLGSKKVLPLKLKCTSEKSLERNISDTEAGMKPVIKINKIILSNKMKQEDGQIEPQKTVISAEPPSIVTEAEPRKKLIIKQTKAVNNVERVRHSIGFGVDENFKKTKRMVELSGFDSYGKRAVRFFGEEVAAHTRATEDRRFWEEEEKRRRRECFKEEKVRRIFEEEKREQQRHIEVMRYEETMGSEREWVTAKKKKKKMKKAVVDDSLEEIDAGKYDKRMADKNRAVKRRPVVDLGQYSAEFCPQTKRRRGGEVALSNVLEGIVDKLRDRREISYLFLKPVSKKEAPDYLDIIHAPMDLSTIRDKVRKMEYRSRREFRQDMWQIAYNAHKYNDGINPGIPPLADQLLRVCDNLLVENKAMLDEAESGIEPWS